ncbi:Bifunctional protein PutA [Novipirellula aureliae]|uniref:L-glutamate gamma-semialdehyde dehydrogenase n=1 Tax=Novipirellula aureliae TaxID=2527966 RepID=A0A5C6DRC3_9BACT|nr:bifunctional proline dehydrogenase/L-glutamate gamma-semialdehyde dehydrogenase [Novipirellula aureliae]TWU38744.1 Bifunctional protein PutA [Novipirellula aureliae]
MTVSTSMIEHAILLAAELLTKAAKLQTPQERRQQSEFDRMVSNPKDKATLVEMTDQAFRTHCAARVADQLTHLLDVQGVPRFFNPVEQVMLKGFQSFGEYLPGVAVPLVKEKMRKETANVILPAEPELLAEHLKNRQKHGVEMNVNLLGEAILGEAEARRRVEQCYRALRMPDLHCLSVKISTLYSQITPLARKHSIGKVADRLEALYRFATNEESKHKGGGNHEKFVYLDMEEYRDLYLTADILCETLDREGLSDARAGVALQAYLPDSYPVMMRLIDWSQRRVAAGARPLTIRLVKGANMEMERVDASLRGIPAAPYQTKVETDANFKRMLRKLMDAAAEGHVRVGVASHNLFDVSLALLWAIEAGAMEHVQFEMLEGMANHQRRALSQKNVDMVLYAPACFKDGFLNAVGYLIRRLDENTGPDNFLRHAYQLQPGSEDFERLANGFRNSFELIDSVSDEPRRIEWERPAKDLSPSVGDSWDTFVNEPDTDWSLPANADWIEGVLKTWKDRCTDLTSELPDKAIGDDREVVTRYDPSRPDFAVCTYHPLSVNELEQTVDRAANDEDGWSKTTLEYRHKLLRSAASLLRERRGDFIAVMMADGGKTVSESDPEVSEAIDFCEFYPLTAKYWAEDPNIRVCPRGVVAVVSPWNFPLAIPAGGIASALAAGNRVLLKPASQTVLTAWKLCQAFWDAGVPKSALQLAACSGQTAEAGLIKNPKVDVVILTGGTETAKRMLAARPDLYLLAETGGKNATIVTAMADRELAVKHVVQSAFGHCGQKCSATSLLLLEEEVFNDKDFKALLADAVESIRVGSSWDLSTRMGPLQSKPTADLNHAMKTLENDESWLVHPERVDDNPNLYRPSVKWNIEPGSFSHLTELFGPVLGVMRYSKLEEAIEIVRSTGYGLTSGIESLDDREIDLWRDTIHAGNLYINRPTTGAIVLRQPFGGVGLSAYGPGVKAGGPHYVLSLMHVGNADALPTEANQDPLDRRLTDWLLQSDLDQSIKQRVRTAIASQQKAWEREFSKQHDTFHLIGQDNIRRYRSTQGLNIRVVANDLLEDMLVCLTAAITTESQITLSIDPGIDLKITETLDSLADTFPGLLHPLEESTSELAVRLREGNVGRIRVLSNEVADELEEAAADAFVTILRDPVVLDGRIECLRYLDEQSISHDYHRYGNLGRRSLLS